MVVSRRREKLFFLELNSVGARSFEHEVAICNFSPIVRRALCNIKQMDKQKKTKGH